MCVCVCLRARSYLRTRVSEESSAFYSTCFELWLLKIYQKSELLLNLLFILHILPWIAFVQKKIVILCL